MRICSKFVSYKKVDGAYLIHTDAADIKVCFLTDEILRVRASFDRIMEEESYVLSAVAWEDRLDDFFEGERNKIEPVEPGFYEEKETLRWTSGFFTLELTKSPLCFKLYDNKNTLLYSDVQGSPFVCDSNGRRIHYNQMEEEECFYGFGEKTGELNKNKRFLRQKATDCMGFDPISADTLYKHIPFYIRMSRSTKKALGMFYNNFFESVFNMGCEKSNYWPRYSYYQTDGGDIDLFFIGGNRMDKIVDNYTFLTGRPLLLPKRAYGYQGSSMYYTELERDCDDAVINFIDTVKAEGFPIDGFHLSSGYTSLNNKRYVFNWNTERFKNPGRYFKTMNEKGAQNVPNIKPGILLTHPLFAEFEHQDVFIKSSQDERTYATGNWWGGEGAFWDFTRASARRIWKKYLTENIIRLGTHSIWNDNCEYDSLLDKDAVCDFDGKKGTLAQLKPMMSTIMCKLANDAVVEYDENARPYVVCRSGSAGIQRYAQTWCGDNYTSWESLKYNIPTITGMGLCGQPNEGADIGGFAGPAPSEELFTRWVQHGIFQPRFSIHSASDDNTVTEPWMYQNSKNIIREAILFRYRMIPYLYSLGYESHITGAPIMRPLVYEFQNDEKVFDESFEFMFGKGILVANVLEEGQETKPVYLPKGSKWYDFNNNYRCCEGGQIIEIPVDRTSIPMFIREGAVIPIALNQPKNMERDKVTDLKLIVAPGRETAGFTLYDDDGVSNDFRKGAYKKTEITVSGTKVINMEFRISGDYDDPVDHLLVEIIRKDRAPFFVELGDRRLEPFLNRVKFEQASEGWYYSHTKKAVEVKYPNPRKDYVLSVSFEKFDLIEM